MHFSKFAVFACIFDDFRRFTTTENGRKPANPAGKATRKPKKRAGKKKFREPGHPSGAQSDPNERSRAPDSFFRPFFAGDPDGASGPLFLVPKTGENGPKPPFWAGFRPPAAREHRKSKNSRNIVMRSKNYNGQVVKDRCKCPKTPAEPPEQCS